MPPWPVFDEEAVEAVAALLRSGRVNYWTGTEGKSLETEYAEALGRRHGIVVANGTLALELALRAFGIGAGDRVVVPARTFIATASSVVAVGATPVVCDIDPTSGNMTAETAAAVLDEHVRAVIPVHVGGWPVDLQPILDLARTRDLIVIEDCAQAHGGSIHGRPIGSPGSHAAAFSFCQDKILPVGEGGLLVLDDEAAFERAWAYKDHGKSWPKVNDRSLMCSTGFKWLIDEFGSNFRMDEMSAAVGRIGLRKLPEWHATRTRNARRLALGLSAVPGLTVPLPGPGFEHAFYRLYAYLETEMLASDWNRDRVIDAIAAEGVPVQYGTCAEIYREAAFRKDGIAPEGRLPVAARVHETSLAFFVHPTLGDDDIDDTIEAVRKVMEVATA